MSEISDEEIRVVRWVERILPPLLVASVLALATCSQQSQQALAQLQNTVGNMRDQRDETREALNKFQIKQDALLKSQHKVEVQVRELQTHQDHIKQDVADVKKQNEQILMILRESGNYPSGRDQ